MGNKSAQKEDQSKNIGEEKVSEQEVQDKSSEIDSEPTESNLESKSEESQEVADENGNPSETDEAINEDEQEALEEEELDPVTKLENKLKEQEDKYIRLLAELENFKRRSQQETRNKLKFAGQNLATDIIPGLDNLERAIEHAKEENNEQLSEFIKGVEMVQQTFYEALSKNSIERQFPEKEPFDPNHHEAVGVVQTDEIQPEHVAQVFQAGYIMHDRVIRPAMVQVAKKK